MRKPILRFFEETKPKTLKPEEIKGEKIAKDIGNPYTTASFMEIRPEALKSFKESIVSVASNVRKAMAEKVNGASGSAAEVLASASIKSTLIPEDDDFIASELGLVLSYGWSHFDPECSPVKDKTEAKKLAKGILLFLKNKQKLEIDPHGLSKNIFIFLHAILLSAICPTEAEVAPASEAQPPVQ